MAHLLLLGSGKGMMEIAALLHASEHLVTLAPNLAELQRPESLRFDLMLAEMDGNADPAAVAETASRLSISWLSRSGSPDPTATIAAYKAGALAVLPWDASADVVQRTIARLLPPLHPAQSSGGSPPNRASRRHYRAGERILLDSESALEVQEGVVALTVIHDDGAEALLGLYGPGQVLAGHPEDACGIQLYAHTEVKVRTGSWPETARQPGFPERLRDHLRQMEAWAAMQACQQLEQRLLDLFCLLAERFGRASPRGTMIDVRLTHAQLASAVGATRATVTRRLGLLRRHGCLIVTGSGLERRYCLRDREDASAQVSVRTPRMCDRAHRAAARSPRVPDV